MDKNVFFRISAAKKLLAPGIQKPIYLLNFVTNSCNAACDHCFYWKELNTKKNEELSVREHTEIARSLGSMYQITFTGGSPELRKDLPEIVYEYYKYCKPSNMTFCMLGYNTDRIISQVTKMLEQCVGQQITIGISLDGLGEEHDFYRKLDGLFERVVTTIHALNDLKKKYSNLRISIGMVVHGLNADKVENSAIWVRKNLPIDILKPILVRGNPLNPETRNDDCIQRYDNIVERDKQWLLNKGSGKIKFLDKVIRAKENVQRDIIKKISSTNHSDLICSGGRETAVMYPNGNIAGCEMRDDVLGNVREFDYNVKSIWFSKNADSFRKTVNKVKECEGCYHHCFISPAIFRTPTMWPRIAKSILNLNNNKLLND
jgi:radical SAM protein with 4Fe4S-binding SPASM domain